MIVKFLNPSASFGGVRYNTDKIEEAKGELIVARNFGVLEALAKPRPQDYVNYLKSWSARSSRIQLPQLHVALSVKGREMDKHRLAELAESWLEKMGYGSNPYLLVFHKDTRNNHLHIVSSRIGPDGKKINDSFERKRGYQVMDELLGIDRDSKMNSDVALALSYNFGTRAQFMMLMESLGYRVKSTDAFYQLTKFGEQFQELPLSMLDEKITAYLPEKNRIEQLRSIINKYQKLYSPSLLPQYESLPDQRQGKLTGYTSELTSHLLDKFGLTFVFHSKDSKPPYGYTVIDHARKSVYKGSLIIPLQKLISEMPLANESAEPADEQFENTDKATYEGVPANLPVDQSPLIDISASAGEFENTDHLSYERVPPNLPVDQSPLIDISDPAGGNPIIYVPALRIDIVSDIDDEQLLGRNRRRKRKAGTNTR